MDPAMMSFQQDSRIYCRLRQIPLAFSGYTARNRRSVHWGTIGQLSGSGSPSAPAIDATAGPLAGFGTLPPGPAFSPLTLWGARRSALSAVDRVQVDCTIQY